MRILLDIILPKMLPVEIRFRIYPHQGKQHLEKSLPKTIPTISAIPNARILIIQDQDSNDCTALKARLIRIVHDKCKAPYFVRIACKTMENWFLGDLPALERTFPRFRATHYSSNADFRRVDGIVNASDRMLRIIPEFQGRSRLPKVETAQKVAPHLSFTDNTSTSFYQLLSAIRKLAGIEPGHQLKLI